MKEIVDITNITKIKFRRSGAHCGLGESEVGRSHDWSPGVLSCNAYAGRVPAPKHHWWMEPVITHYSLSWPT